MGWRTRIPCKRCGGEKQAGHGRIYCDACQAKGEPLMGMEADVRAEIVRLYVDERWSMQEVAVEVYWSSSSVRRVLIADGVELRRRGVPGRKPHHRTPLPETIDRTIELYQAGYSTTEVARRLGIARSTVFGRLRRAGVQLRPMVESVHLAHIATLATGQRTLTDRQAAALQLVQARESVTSGDVARRLQVSRITGRLVLEQLERVGLVQRRVVMRPRRHFVFTRTDVRFGDVLEAAITPVAQLETRETWLPIAPFRAWLEAIIAVDTRSALAIAAPGRPRATPGTGSNVNKMFAERLGVTERRLYALRYEQQSVTLRMADRCLTQVGDGARLGDLWPELAEGGDVTALPRRAMGGRDTSGQFAVAA